MVFIGGREASVCEKGLFLTDEITVDDVIKGADGCRCSTRVRPSKFVEKHIRYNISPLTGIADVLPILLLNGYISY